MTDAQQPPVPQQPQPHQAVSPAAATGHTPGQPYAAPGQPYAAPGQPYAAPSQPGQAPGQPYGAPGQPPYGVPGPAYAAGQRGATNSLGRTAFIVALITLAVGLLSQLSVPLLYGSGMYGVVAPVSTALNTVLFIANAAALTLGLIALRRPAPHVFAGIAVGISGAGLAGVVMSWLTSVFFYFV